MTITPDQLTALQTKVTALANDLKTSADASAASNAADTAASAATATAAAARAQEAAADAAANADFADLKSFVDSLGAPTPAPG